MGKAAERRRAYFSSAPRSACSKVDARTLNRDWWRIGPNIEEKMGARGSDPMPCLRSNVDMHLLIL